MSCLFYFSLCPFTTSTVIYTLSLHDALPILFPHRFNDNRYHVHLGKEGPYIPVTDTRDIPSYLADRKSTRLNSSHGSISYAVFCLKKKKTQVVSNMRETALLPG